MILISADCELCNFDSEDMLPDFQEKEVPTVAFFTPVHFRERCFGYSCLKTDGNIDDFNFNYVRFCREINNGLEFLCMQNELKRFAYREYTAQSRDKLTGLFQPESCLHLWDEISDIARIYREDIYMLAVSAGGLRHIENEAGSDVSDRYLIMFADILSKSCNSKERIFKAGEKEFVIIGTESSPVDRPGNYLKYVEEEFRRQNTANGGSYIVYPKHEVRLIPMTQALHTDEVIEELREMFRRISETSHTACQNRYTTLRLQRCAGTRKSIFRNNPQNAIGINKAIKHNIRAPLKTTGKSRSTSSACIFSVILYQNFLTYASMPAKF